MPMIWKYIFLDGEQLHARARTTVEAARAAVDVGAKFNASNPVDRAQHVGEGPLGFYVSRQPGNYKRRALIGMALSLLMLALPALAQTPIIVDPSTGKYLGNLNNNRFDPNSISNPFGRYGSKFSPDSINNKFSRYGSEFSPSSPNNPFATGVVRSPYPSPMMDDDGD